MLTHILTEESPKKQIGLGLILFLGNEESGMNYADNHYRLARIVPACIMLAFEINSYKQEKLKEDIEREGSNALIRKSVKYTVIIMY